jgi:hypothetical protein
MHEHSEVSLRNLPHGQQGYPYAVQVDATYRVDAETGLHVTLTATNKGTRPAPRGRRRAPLPYDRHADDRRLRGHAARRPLAARR